jgi:hypothetical protein
MINTFNYENLPHGNEIVEALLEEIQSRPELKTRRRKRKQTIVSEIRDERSKRLKAILENRQFYTKNDGTKVHVIQSDE